MDLRGQEKILGMPNSLGISYNNNPSIGEQTSKISLSSTGNGISVISPPHSTTVDHHHHHYYRPKNRQDSPGPPPQSQDPERDPDPVSIAVVTASIAPIITVGSNPRTPKTKITQASSVRYRECLKNHAATIGGHVVDGCGEFMPSGEDGTAEALKCAACDCHRNFHRKEAEGESQSHHQHGGIGNCFYCYNPNSKNRSTRLTPHTLPPPPAPASTTIQQHQKFSLGLPTSPPSGPMMMAFGGSGATESSSEEPTVYHSNAGAAAVGLSQFAISKKRFRTKFSQEQKDRMLEFAEKVGWRIQKQDELAVQQFCGEVGVKRKVLKVWLHNNKHTMKKREI